MWGGGGGGGGRGAGGGGGGERRQEANRKDRTPFFFFFFSNRFPAAVFSSCQLLTDGLVALTAIAIKVTTEESWLETVSRTNNFLHNAGDGRHKPVQMTVSFFSCMNCNCRIEEMCLAILATMPRHEKTIAGLLGRPCSRQDTQRSGKQFHKLTSVCPRPKVLLSLFRSIVTGTCRDCQREDLYGQNDLSPPKATGQRGCCQFVTCCFKYP